jgi:hypothetical protein
MKQDPQALEEPRDLGTADIKVGVGTKTVDREEVAETITQSSKKGDTSCLEVTERALPGRDP